MAYSLCAGERETIISFDDSSEAASLYTSNPVWLRKLDRLTARNPEQFHEVSADLVEGKVIAKSYEFPKRFITIRAKDVVREITEEEREERRQRSASFLAPELLRLLR